MYLPEHFKENDIEEIKAIVKDAFTNSLKQLTTEFTKTYTSGDNGPEEAKTLCIDKLIPKEKEILSIIDKYKLDMQVTDKMKISYIYDSLYPAQEKNTWPLSNLPHDKSLKKPVEPAFSF